MTVAQSPKPAVPDFESGGLLIPIQEEGEDYGADGPADTSPLQGKKTPQEISRALAEATEFCKSLPGDGYLIDCLAYEYWEIQRQLPDFGETAEVKQILKDTSKKLRRLAVDNQSKSHKPLRVTRGGKKLNRALVAVDPKRLPQLNQQAATIINNGATLLLRASGDSDRKRAQYQQIAKSMQTGAILLRSL